jgi:hypothetical protein
VELTQWSVGDIAIDRKGTRWKVLAVDDSKQLEYPDLDIELSDSSNRPAFRDVMSSRLLRKETQNVCPIHGPYDGECKKCLERML